MHVGVVTPWYPHEGSVYLGVFVQQQVEALRSLGHQVDVDVLQLFPGDAEGIPAEVASAMRELAERDLDAAYRRHHGATWIPAPVPSGGGAVGRTSAFGAAWRAKQELAPVRPDVVHAHLGVPTAAAIMDDVECPLVVTEHQSTLRAVLELRQARDLYAEAVQRADRFFVVSAHLRDLIVDHIGDWARDEIDVMPNIVDLSDLTFRLRSGVGRRWLYVGALVRSKGVRLLTNAFLSYRRRFDPDAQLTLVGDGADRDWIETTVRRAGASDAVRFTGSVPRGELDEPMAEADVYVHMSPAETFGIASLEALGAGLPVVSLANGGSEHAWGEIEAIAGRLLPQGTGADDVAAAVASLRTDDRLDPAAARAFVEAKYSSEAVGARLAQAYRDVTG